MFNTSLGEAQSNSALPFEYLPATSCMDFIGSIPISAIRPQNIEKIMGDLFLIYTTWSASVAAVTFTLMPSLDNLSIIFLQYSPRVVWQGIFTYTFPPQLEIILACRSISSNSSANTSKETGLPFTTIRTSLQNFS